MISRRPPVSVVAYIAVVVALLLAAFITDGADPRLLAGGVVLGASLVGLYLRIRIVWILVTAFQAGNLLLALGSEAAWWIVAIVVVQLALLLAPPTRRYFRREPSLASEGVSRTGRGVRLFGAVLAGLLLGVIAYAVLFPPDPISGDLELVRSDRPGLRVLFVGNTLTADNSMTTMVRQLGEGDRQGPPVFAVQYARRGSTLEDALDDSRLAELLEGERWSHVVLQEHSQVISRPADREARTFPALIALDRMVRRSGAQTVLFATWGYERGDRDAIPGDTYQAMEARMRRGYFESASRLPAVMAPVGLAWAEALSRQPRLDLWSKDGRRPSQTGSYLAASVLYAALTRRDPTGGRFTAGLEPARAQSLQRIARESVRQTYPEALALQR